MDSFIKYYKISFIITALIVGLCIYYRIDNHIATDNSKVITKVDDILETHNISSPYTVSFKDTLTVEQKENYIEDLTYN